MSVQEELANEKILISQHANNKAEQIKVEINGINKLLPLWEVQEFKMFIDLISSERVANAKKMETSNSEFELLRASGAALALGRLVDMKDTLRNRKKSLEVILQKINEGAYDE